MQLPLKEKKRLFTQYGPWAVVTGASSGIGLELARQLAGAGFNIIINGRDEEKLIALKTEITSTHTVEVVTVAADLSIEPGIQSIIDATKDLDIGLLIHSAGFGTSGLFAELNPEQEINMLRVNVEAVISLTHHFIQRCKQKRKAGIVFLSSLVAFQGVPYSANYAATKAYIQSFAEALSVELQGFSIDVLAVAPGPVNSGFGARADMKMGKALLPSQIGVPILQALGRKTTVVPGTLSKILVYSLRTVPRWLKIRIMHKVMHDFTRHQRIS
jgi:short-subunit dehydrogenase